MTVEKLPSGKYRATIMINGTRYRKTFDHKPKKAELERMRAEIADTSGPSGLTIEAAMTRYISARQPGCSPATIKAYRSYLKKFPEWFAKLKLSSVTEEQVQIAMNEIAMLPKNRSDEPLSEKYLKNVLGLFTAACGMFRPKFQPNITIRRDIKIEPYIPSDSDIALLLSEAEGTKYDIALNLACYSLRRSEICALELSDLDGNILDINKAMVQNDHEEWEIRPNKTDGSARMIAIEPELADKIRARGYIYHGHPNSISNYMDRTLKRLGLPHFSVHKLRHYFATSASSQGVPEENVLKMGGWKTDRVMKSVYRHADKEKLEENSKKYIEHMKSLK